MQSKSCDWCFLTQLGYSTLLTNLQYIVDQYIDVLCKLHIEKSPLGGTTLNNLIKSKQLYLIIIFSRQLNPTGSITGPSCCLRVLRQDPSQRYPKNHPIATPSSAILYQSTIG